MSTYHSQISPVFHIFDMSFKLGSFYFILFSNFSSFQGLHGGSTNGWIELVLIEAKDLVAADLRGTSDPYVRIDYGNLKRRTKVRYASITKR